MRVAGALLCVSLLGVALGPRRAHAEETTTATTTAPTVAQVRGWAEALGNEGADVRHDALMELLTLDRSALPAIRARLLEVRGAGIDAPRLQAKLSLLRRMHTGRTSELAAGLSRALAHDPGAAMQLAVELTALDHALVAQHTPEAAEVLVGSLFVLAPAVLRVEATRARRRLGMLLAPAYIHHVGHTDTPLSRLSRAALGALGAATARQAFERAEPAQLPVLLHAYRESRAPDALPWIIAYVGDPRRPIHEAAVEAARAYGDASVSLLRRRYVQVVGDAPTSGIAAAQILRELEQQMVRPAIRALTAADSLLRAGKLSEAEHALATALQHSSDRTTAQRTAAAYFTLAAQLEAANKPADALRAYRRAARSAPEPTLANAAEARVLQLEATEQLTRGIVDVAALQTAVTLDPSLAPASALLSEVQGERLAGERSKKRRLGLLAAALMASAAALLLRDARQRARQPPGTA